MTTTETTPKLVAPLSNRVKSFLWRLGMMLVATALDFTAKNLTDFDLSTQTTVILGLILGEVSKFIANRK